MILPENDVLLLAMDGAPCANPPFQCPANAITQFRVTPDHLFEDGDGTDAWGCPQHRHNRSQPLFQVFSGVVDTDTYQSHIHFPFVATAPDGVHVVKKGTPLLQVIPFRRDATQIDAVIRAETETEALRRTRIARNTQADEGWYRTTARGIR